MNMQLLTSILVLLASIGSAVWNLHVKKAPHSLSFVTLMVLPQFVIAALLATLVPMPSGFSFSYLILSAFVQNIYIIFLITAYRSGMLSRVYPLAVGTATVIALIFWHVVLGTHISLLEYIGILLITLVIANITFIKRTEGVISLSSILYALATSFFIFAYSTIDTFGVRSVANPLSYISWLFMIKAVMLFFPMFFLQKINWEGFINRKYILPGILAGIGYGVAVFAFTFSPTSIVLALRSTSILFIFVISIFILKEKANARIFYLTLASFLGVFLILLGA